MTTKEKAIFILKILDKQDAALKNELKEALNYISDNEVIKELKKMKPYDAVQSYGGIISARLSKLM